MVSWDQYFLEMAKLVSVKSKDKNTKIGSVIVGPDNEIISTGYNSFPRGLNDDLEERYKRPEKYFWTEHSERNAIYNAARHGTALKGCKMYCSCNIPCTDCMRAIIQVGIKEVVLGTRKTTSTMWTDHGLRSIEMIKETGLIIRLPDCENPIPNHELKYYI